MNKSVNALILTLSILATSGISSIASAQVFTNINYTVKSGDSIWRICYKYKVRVSEVIGANPQISNPNLIYVNQIVKVPNLSSVKLIEKQVVTILNSERAKANLTPLKLNWQLSRVARYKSQDMIDKNYFSHQSPTYDSTFDMMKNFGIKYMAADENIAYGQRTATEVMKGWMNCRDIELIY